MSLSASDSAAAPAIGAAEPATPRLILASASASRAAVMRQAGLAALCEPAQIDEAEVKLGLKAEGAGAQVIAETLAECGSRSQDPGALTAAVRVALGRSIVQHINGMGPEVQVITLDPSLEQILQQSIQAVSEGGAGIEPGLAERMHRSLSESAQRQEAAGQAAILLVTPPIRPWLAKLVRHSIPGLHVLAYNEVPDNKQIKVVANIGTDKPGLGVRQDGGQGA